MGTTVPGIRVWHALQRALKGAGGLAKTARPSRQPAESAPRPSGPRDRPRDTPKIRPEQDFFDDLLERFKSGMSLEEPRSFESIPHRAWSPDLLRHLESEAELRCDACDCEEERGREEKLKHQRDQDRTAPRR